jgi:type II secretory pathway component PulF
MSGVYYYKALNREGRVVRGSVRGVDLGAARVYVLSAGLYLLKIREAGRLQRRLMALASGSKTGTREIIEFSRSMATMLRSGVPVLLAISEIAQGTGKRAFREILEDTAKYIEDGASFSEAFEKQKKVFPEILVRLSKIGEETGGLDRSFEDAASHLEKMEELYSTMKKALMYPLFAVVFTFGALIFWLFFVLPKVMSLFTDMSLTMPLPTRLLLVTTRFCRGYWYVLVLLPLAVAGIIALLRKNRRTKYYLDLAVLRMPIMRHITFNWQLTFFSEQLRILTSAGIPINRALKVIYSSLGNEVMKTSTEEVRRDVESGTAISEAMKRHAVFPGLMTRLVSVGERSGSLDAQFAYIANFYGKRLNEFSEKLGKMLEPLIMSLVGVMFAIIILGLLMPIYDLISNVG